LCDPPPFVIWISRNMSHGNLRHGCQVLSKSVITGILPWVRMRTIRAACVEDVGEWKRTLAIHARRVGFIPPVSSLSGIQVVIHRSYCLYWLPKPSCARRKVWGRVATWEQCANGVHRKWNSLPLGSWSATGGIMPNTRYTQMNRITDDLHHARLLVAIWPVAFSMLYWICWPEMSHFPCYPVNKRATVNYVLNLSAEKDLKHAERCGLWTATAIMQARARSTGKLKGALDARQDAAVAIAGGWITSMNTLG
jgi:hypothetical protein